MTTAPPLITVDATVPVHFKSGERVGKCVEVVMLQEPWLAARLMERPNDSLWRRLQLRVRQGRSPRNTATICPVCDKQPVTQIAVSHFGNPAFASDRTACSLHTKSELCRYAGGRFAQYLPIEIFPVSWQAIPSICKHLGLRGEKTVQVTDFILDLCGFPPSATISPEDAVRFFNNEPPSHR